MLASRRSLLRSLGILSAAPLTPIATSLAAQAPHSAAAVRPATIPRGSLVIVFEGPWIFSHDPSSPRTFVATTLGSDTHASEFGFWDGHNNFNDPFSPTAPPQRKSPGHPIAETDKITGVPAAGSAAGSGLSLDDLFLTAFGTDQFTYLKGGAGNSLTLTPAGKFRQVYLPMPDALYVGGQLTSAVLTDNSKVLQRNGSSPTQPYIATVLEYSAANGSRTIDLTVSNQSGAGTVTLNSTQDTIFRTRPNTIMTGGMQIQHVKDTFATLISWIKKGGKAIDVKITTLGSDDAYPGGNIGGLDPSELGLTPMPLTSPMVTANKNGAQITFRAFSSTLGNCDGGGIGMGG